MTDISPVSSVSFYVDEIVLCRLGLYRCRRLPSVLRREKRFLRSRQVVRHGVYRNKKGCDSSSEKRPNEIFVLFIYGTKRVLSDLTVVNKVTLTIVVEESESFNRVKLTI